MSTDPNKLPATDLVTPEVRLSFPQLFVAKAPPVTEENTNPKKKFSTILLMPPTVSLEPFVAAVKAAMLKKWGQIVQLAPDKQPIKDAKANKPTMKGFDQGWRYITASANEDRRPAVVDQRNVPVTDPSKVYPGMWVRAYINAFAYGGTPGRPKGVSFGLNAIQIVRDGERLGGAAKAPNEVFTPLELPTDGTDTSSLDNLFS